MSQLANNLGSISAHKSRDQALLLRADDGRLHMHIGSVMSHRTIENLFVWECLDSLYNLCSPERHILCTGDDGLDLIFISTRSLSDPQIHLYSEKAISSVTLYQYVVLKSVSQRVMAYVIVIPWVVRLYVEIIHEL